MKVLPSLIVAAISLFISGANGTLLASDYSDGGCVFPPPAANATNIFVIYATPQIYSAYYVSKSYAINYAKVFLGQDPAEWSEVDGLCYNIQFSDGFAIQTGYNQSKVWIDTATPAVNITYPSGMFTYNLTVRVSPGVNSAPRDNFSQTAIWSDGVKHVLTINCILGQTQDWSLFSANGPPDQWAKDLTLNKITELGMSADNAMDFSECPTPPGPVQYTVRAFQSLGLLPFSFTVPPFLMSLIGIVEIVYETALKKLYSIFNVIFPFIPVIPGVPGVG